MARFVSPHRNFSLGVRAHLPERVGPRGILPEVTELSADFTPDDTTDPDLVLALSTFSFRGLPIYENGQPVSPAFRVSVFDSERTKLKNGWTDEDEALVIEALRTKGPIGQMYVEVLPVAAEKPWNGYDELDDVTRIVDLAVGIGADLALVIQYEKENQNRTDVLEALEAAGSEAGETIIVSA